MSFSLNWEDTYQNNRHISVWPWPNLISYFYKTYDRKSSVKVLEIGCGAGANIPFFESLPNVEYFGIDGSPNIIEKLQSRFPNLRDNLRASDFTKEIPFQLKFDYIFDRGAMCCVPLEAVKKTLNNLKGFAKEDGHYIGIDWYSTEHSARQSGEAIGDNGNTRDHYKDGPFQGIGPVHFFSKEEIEDIFIENKILNLKLNKTKDYLPSETEDSIFASWDLIVKL
ncbi:MAG: class I SAM-dependent methyltransferase [Bdellovibrionota bacterium]|nr:class I SAM-dependent methyltransferase [Bdellovibrionota bacterium]